MSCGYRAEYLRIVRENYRRRIVKQIVERLMEFKEVLSVDPKTFVEWFKEELEFLGPETILDYFLLEDYNRIAKEMGWPEKRDIQK